MMAHWWGPWVFLVALFGWSAWLYRSYLKRKACRAALQGCVGFDRDRLLQLIRAHGGNSNSFLAYYEGFFVFQSKKSKAPEGGVLVFADTPRAWVLVAEPLAPESEQEPLLREFCEVARSVGKSVLGLPVSEATVRRLAPLGFGSLQIGSEPTFRLAYYKPQIETVPVAKQMHNKGARVRAFRPESLDPLIRAQLDSMLQEWLDSRKTSPLGFLNQVLPWSYTEEKRYFLVEQKDKALAFLSAIPMPPKKGWYFIDLIRRPDSPPGSTELLVLEAMRLLQGEGAQEITLGVAPLSGLERSPEYAKRPLYRILHWVYGYGGQFYSFKSLHQFKLKFNPSESVPSFMVHWPTPLGIGGVLGLMSAFLPSGMVLATFSGIYRALARFSLPEWIKSQLSPTVVVRSVPPTFARLLSRCRFTVLLLLILPVIYALTVDEYGELQASLLDDGAFSIAALAGGQWSSVLWSQFLHWCPSHLILNLTGILVFVGVLEYLAGTRIAALCAVVPSLLGNVTTAAVIGMPLRMLDPTHWESIAASRDVGASLMFFGAAGALIPFVARQGAYVTALLGFTLLSAWATESWLSLNHAVAFFLGWIVSRLSLRD